MNNHIATTYPRYAQSANLYVENVNNLQPDEWKPSQPASDVFLRTSPMWVIVEKLAKNKKAQEDACSMENI